MDMSNEQSFDLTGQLLIAMPDIGDPRFDHSVIFMCAHSEEGAMGLIINKPAPDVDFGNLLEQLDIEPAPTSIAPQIHFGGPVELGRGFILHSSDYDDDGTTLQVTPGIGMTATLDVLEDIAKGDGPKNAFLALGYAGWGPGQLEVEIQSNGWLTCDAGMDIVFHSAHEEKWTLAIEKLGINPLMLSATGGSA